MKKKDEAIHEMAAHLPDVVIQAAKGLRQLPAVQKLNGVLMFLDISGFTSLCEQFSQQSHGVDRLTKTLNDYLGQIEDLVLKAGGDVIEFAGDAMLILWEGSSGVSCVTALVKAIICSRKIMKICNNWDTDVGVQLGIKISIAVGPVLLTYTGTKASSIHFSSSGVAVTRVNAAERLCEKGTIVLAPSAWDLCPERKSINVEKLDSGHVKIITIRKTWAESELSGTPFQQQKQQKPKALGQTASLRQLNLKNIRERELRLFIAAPVLHKVDDGLPMGYLCEMRDATVVFINLSLDHGNDHCRSLHAVFRTISTAVLQFQGVINKIFEFDKGTSLLVLFGLPGFKHEDEVNHALQCSSQIMILLNAMLEVRFVSIGVTTGKVYCGVVGHLERHEYTVIGPKVNMAARLMMNYPDKLSCDEETRYRSSVDSAHFQDLPAVKLKGMDNPGPIYQYIDSTIAKDQSIPEARHAMLGYMNELLRSLNTLEKACASNDSSHPLFVVVEGEPGVGKTRFLRAVLNAAKKNDMRIVCSRPTVSGTSNPYSTACYLITELLELADVQSPQEREKLLEDRFEGTELLNSLSLLNNLLGIQLSAHPSVCNLSPAERTRALQRLLNNIVQGTQLDSYNGTLIAIDDAQYIDKDTWGYLRYFAGYSCLFVLGMGKFRDTAPEAVEKIFNSPFCVHVKLEGLELINMEALLCQLLEVVSVPRELTNMLASRLTDKINPSWVKQCAANLLHHDQLEINTQREQPECVISKGVRLLELDIPPSLTGCMIAFIDRLPSVERTTVKIASIIGSSFNNAVLSHLMPQITPDVVLKSIGGLVSASVFIFENGQLRFQSSTLQETAYSLLLEKMRRKLHEEYALYLEQRFLGFAKKTRRRTLFRRKSKAVQQRKPATNGEVALQVIYPQLVTHWRRAGNKTKMVEYLIHAAESAVSLGNTMQAISFIYQAKGLVPNTEQLAHLDQLSLQATTTLFLTRARRMNISVNQQRWQSAASKALRLSQANTSVKGQKSTPQPTRVADPYYAKPIAVRPRPVTKKPTPFSVLRWIQNGNPMIRHMAIAVLLFLGFLALYFWLVM